MPLNAAFSVSVSELASPSVVLPLTVNDPSVVMLSPMVLTAKADGILKKISREIVVPAARIFRALFRI